MYMTDWPAFDCSKREQNGADVLAHLPVEVARELTALQSPILYPAGSVIFAENAANKGVYLILEGEVKLSVNSPDGRRLSLQVMRRGELIGLSSTLTGCPHDFTAEALFTTRLAHIGRKDFLNFVSRHPHLHQRLMIELCRQYSLVCDQVRTLGLAASAPERLARLLLDWSEKGHRTELGTTIHFAMTHEEIGEFIGASRETVTRTLATFKGQGVVSLRGSTLTILDRVALTRFLGNLRTASAA
ncbi:MAG TPA: Crp/Fnr family transcriptional regulator [Terracidiphilus sp.]